MRRPAPDANSSGPSACARRRRTKESGEGEIIGRLALLSDPPRARTAIKTARNAPGGHPLTALLPPQTVDRRYLSHRAGRCTPPSPLARPHPPLVVSGGCTRARRRLSAHRTTATTAPATVARRSARMPAVSQPACAASRVRRAPSAPPRARTCCAPPSMPMRRPQRARVPTHHPPSTKAGWGCSGHQPPAAAPPVDSTRACAVQPVSPLACSAAQPADALRAAIQAPV